MKKNLVALLLVLAVVSFGVFAAPPGPIDFTITADVVGVNLMKITTEQYNPPKPTPANFGTAEEHTGTHTVSVGGGQTIDAWISTLSNSRKGYKVTMSATAMKSAAAPEGGGDARYINYTVKVDNDTQKMITTNGASAVSPVIVIQHSSLQKPTATSLQISLEVNATDFEEAVEGEYIGTVTFTYGSN